MQRTPSPPAGGLGRRTFLLGALGALGAAGATVGVVADPLAGPADAATRRMQLQFWHLLGGADGENMNTILGRVNRIDPKATVRQTVLAWGTPYYTKLAMAAAGGRPPDLAISHLSRLEGYAPGGLFDEWDISRFAKYGISADDFTKPTFKRMHVNGKLYAIALDSHSFVRFFNHDIAKKAGVLAADGTLQPTTTVAEFLDQAKAMKSVTGKLGLSYGYLGDPANMWRLFWTFYSQLGATMSATKSKLVFDRSAFSEALGTMKKLLSSSVSEQQASDGFSFSTFTAKQSGEMFTGVWDLSGLKASGIALDASPIPNLFGTGIDAVWGDSHSFVLPHQDDLDEARREASYQAVALVLKNSLTWAKGGHTPAYQPVVHSSAFSKLEPNGHYAKTATFLHYDPQLAFAGSGSNWQNDFGQTVQSALMGAGSVKAARDEFTSMSNQYVQHAVPTDD
ncbi:extracellular solute-binding protein [Frondihabitans australicus]|uniref:Carbohydrate ABC transporter substrate-binding protein (CUT1 family) n=1 Tax=Frondihabitans australicus TaxID=386892 RepID=A0A495IH32_9MICO|nr:extracellular solute-binding protein [Frondihabitans australicus]RKR75297.1 carbohydrate ABC transporter substrate-binding protein (CUT1 family) [Frondihabitans australicus]